jgi:hypothetical protein
MKLILTGDYEATTISTPWRDKCAIEFIPLDRLIAHLKGSQNSGLTADAVVALASSDIEFFGDPSHAIGSPLEAVIKLVSDLRKLDSIHAMPDGRKWNAIPFVVILSADVFDAPIPQSLDVSVIILQGRPEETLKQIEQIFHQYRDRLLDELDNLGLLVTYDHGRYRVGPALTPRDRAKEGYLYYGPADQRGAQPAKYYTVDRDFLGIQYEVELFESLINNPKVTERDLQQFFVEHPHFLITARLLQALPHVPLRDSGGKLLIPDFVLKPIVAAQRDSNWEVLDIKLPLAKLLAGPRDHVRFSRDVVQAITQVRDYKDYFEDPRNSEIVQRTLGHRLRHPKLGVLIGRLPTSKSEIEMLEIQQNREPGVRIVTYDEILEAQKKLAS